MKAPPIYVLTKESGDGYGHGSVTYVAYYFDAAEAEREAEVRNKAKDSDFVRFNVEEVMAADPIPETDLRW